MIYWQAGYLPFYFLSRNRYAHGLAEGVRAGGPGNYGKGWGVCYR
jgi:hypothetical protein